MKTRNLFITLLISVCLLFAYSFSSAQAVVWHGNKATLDLSPIPAPCQIFTAYNSHVVIRPNGSAMMRNSFNVGDCTETIYSFLLFYEIDAEYPQAVNHIPEGIFTAQIDGIWTEDTKTVGNSSGILIITSRWPKGTFSYMFD